MDNKKDKKHIANRIQMLKEYSAKIKECLSEVELIAVDNNNSRVKDESLKKELENLSSQINSISTSINTIEDNLK